ncbi:MAG: hypothetical protein ABMA64_18400 [Myxococcota bacterium]
MPSATHTRVLELLAEARRAVALRGRLEAAGKDVTEVDAALAALYRDLGQGMVEAAEEDGGLLFESLRRPEEPDYELEDQESWYDDRDPPSGPRAVGPLFDPEDLAGIPDTELDESTPVIASQREYTDSDTPIDFVVATVAGLGSAATADPGHPFAQLRGGSPPEWRPGLDGLLPLLELPTNFFDLDELRTESSRLQWATSELELRLAPLPAEVRIAVVGMLGARAHHLRDRLDSDVGPRVLLDRLQRYRLAHHLAVVAAFLPTPRPEYGTWEEDARRWSTLLRTGFAASAATPRDGRVGSG